MTYVASDLVEYFTDILQPLFDDRPVVVWYDPEAALEKPLRAAAEQRSWVMVPAPGAVNPLAARVEIEEQMRADGLQWLAAGAVGTLALPDVVRASEREVEKAATKGNIAHSVVTWCFEPHWSFDELCKNARQLGCRSVELSSPVLWPTVKKYGLTCAIAPSHLFVQGMNNPKYQAGCLEILRKRIDQCADAGTKTVITFTGYAEESGDWADGANPDLKKLPPNRAKIDPETGASNCVTGFKKIVGYAEKKKINLAMEMLNTRASDHPMKGHPGFQGTRAMSARRDRTAAVIVFAQSSIEQMKTLIAFRALDEIEGQREQEFVTELCKHADGDVLEVSIFRWPAGTTDTQIASDITKLFAVVASAPPGKVVIPTRYCLGDLGGKVDDQFVQEVAPRLARAYEQAEMAWEMSHATSYPVSVRQDKEEIEWMVQSVITPDTVAATMTDADLMRKEVEGFSAQHEREYGTPPKAVAIVTFVRRRPIREVSSELSKVIRKLAQWSRPYEGTQLCYWKFDVPGIETFVIHRGGKR
jgi:hypothetical protein